jgi:hypothetical protein
VKKDTPWRDAIQMVLAESATTLHYKDIADRIVASKMRTSVGATPASTVSAYLTTSIKNEGDKSPFLKVGPGQYVLRNLAIGQSGAASAQTEPDQDEEQYSIITSFGMFWRRTFVSWTSSAKLLGMQQIGSAPVNFAGQYGIYLLYDGREVIYVGRSTDRPLGRRLFEHTFDRLATRWDRFSWFGVLPVSDDGTLGEMPPSYPSQSVIPALEAVLIEALEPRQNRRRGDDLAAVEYIQNEDPELKRKQLKETFESVLQRV